MDSRPMAVIPLKSLSQAKGRLADALGSTERRDLTIWMLDQVLAACAACSVVADVLVVAGDAATAELVRTRSVDAVVERAPGLDAALALTDELLGDRRATLVIAADLPLLTSADIGDVVRAGTQDGTVVVAPTHDGGTGGLLRRPPRAIPTAFGEGSADAHLRLAIDAGLRAITVHAAGFRFDVDTALQLQDLGPGPWRR